MRKEFPGVHIYGCIFHFSQSLVKKACDVSIGMATDLRKPGEVLSNFLAFTALPLLPAKMIAPAFQKLAARARGTHVGFPAFLQYFSSFWLGEIGAENLSVYGLRRRTNNDLESNNNKFLRRAGPDGPVWSLVSIIADFARDVAVNKELSDQGVQHILSKPSKNTRRNSLRINSSWAKLSTGELTDLEFLDRVKFKVGKVNHRKSLASLCLRAQGDPTLKAWLTAGSSKSPEDDHSSVPPLPASESDLRHASSGNSATRSEVS